MSRAVLVTGAAGMIGSRLVQTLVAAGHSTLAVDRVPLETCDNLLPVVGDNRFAYVQGDIDSFAPTIGEHGPFTTVYHLAANTENRPDRSGRLADLHTSVVGTVSLLEHLSATGTRPTVVLTSSQLVYGSRVPTADTDEDDAPVEPITRFAAGKVACEAFLSAYAHENGLISASCRLSNIVGPNSNRGIIADLVDRLLGTPRELSILGDGRQRRSYLDVDDCAAALVAVADAIEKPHTVFNVCNTSTTSALRVAEIVASLHSATPPVITVQNTERGWTGDIPTLDLHPAKLLRTGWAPRISSDDAVERAARALLRTRSAAGMVGTADISGRPPADGAS